MSEFQSYMLTPIPLLQHLTHLPNSSFDGY